MISEGFHCPPDVAAQQDLGLCMRILTMRAYHDTLAREERGDKLTSDDYRFIVPLERAAGIGVEG